MPLPGFNNSCSYALPQAPELIDALGVSSDWFDGSGVPKTKTLAEMQSLGVGPRFFHGATNHQTALYSVNQDAASQIKIAKVIK